MLSSIREPTVPRSPSTQTSSILRGPRKPFVPAVREPYHLPNQEVELPPPEASPGKPPAFNWLGSLLPPALIVTGMLIVSRLVPNAGSFIYFSMIMSLGFPLANLGNLFLQKRNYQKALEQRRQNYERTLERERQYLMSLAQRQRNTLQKAHPSRAEVVAIARGQGKKRLLWWRRPQDGDFLGLRIGAARGKPSFSIVPPKISDPFDDLKALPSELLQEFETIPKLPFLIKMKKVGSLGVTGNEPKAVYGATRRLILDALVHHSPGDLHIVLLCNTGQGVKRWEWLKWAPHSGALSREQDFRPIAFTTEAINKGIQWLVDVYSQRARQQKQPDQEHTDFPAVLAILDDKGDVRQHPDLMKIVANGRDYGLYMLFVGDKHLPRVHARLDVSSQGGFRYVETWEGGETTRGKAEFCGLAECDQVARALSQLELMGAKAAVVLPESLRLSQLLGDNLFTNHRLRENWETIRSDLELLQFPIGVQVTREGLETLFVNLLPTEKGGEDAYHTILIGTTGSGKSEFMKSLVLAAMYTYAPRDLNFFFMDFKGGAAFDIFNGLPHVAGVVTNLMNPALTRRGLIAIDSEISRRQEEFGRANVRDIWFYNQKYPHSPMPHLVLLLDEFARGLQDFPDQLKKILDLLVRQGRSLGMYLILANQDMNAAVESLLNNVGWRIALRVAKIAELHVMLENKSLRPPRRPGQGYLRSLIGEISEFQAAYAGFPALTENVEDAFEFQIYEVNPEGVFTPIYKHEPSRLHAENTDGQTAPPLEQDVLIELLRQTAHESNLPAVRPIYLEPLPESVPLSSVLGTAGSYRQFDTAGWSQPQAGQKAFDIPLGLLDFPERCLQTPLKVDLTARDGHLWIAGSPGSGKAMALKTLLLSLAASHTPQEAHIYVLEFGAGTLRVLETLPHVGAVIRLPDAERVERLFDYLAHEMERRKEEAYHREADPAAGDSPTQAAARKPHIFVVINNFAELRSNYFDFVDRTASLVQDGNAVGIHLIVTTNRSGDVPPKISSNISRRIVLKMANRDEYFDLTKKKVPSLLTSAAGRGYWVDEEVAECQIAQPLLDGLGERPQDERAVLSAMRQAWRGTPAPRIRTLAKCVPLSEVLPIFPAHTGQPGASIPVGIAYASLELIRPDLAAEMRQWTVLGPAQSGKSNFLLAAALSLLDLGLADWEVWAFTFRPSPLQKLAAAEAVQLFTTPEQIEAACQQLEARLNAAATRRVLWLIDDLGAAFEPGREKIAAALNTIGLQLTVRENVHLMAAAMVDEIRVRRGSNALVRLLGQSNTGLCFSTDFQLLDWLGVAPNTVRAHSKREFPPGRGFFVRRGQAVLVQTPLAAECPPGSSSGYHP